MINIYHTLSIPLPHVLSSSLVPSTLNCFSLFPTFPLSLSMLYPFFFSLLIYSSYHFSSFLLALHYFLSLPLSITSSFFPFSFLVFLAPFSNNSNIDLHLSRISQANILITSNVQNRMAAGYPTGQ